MAETPAQKEARQSIQTDLKDLVLGKLEPDTEPGPTEPESDEAGDSSPRGEEGVSDDASADADLPLKAKTAKRFEKLTADLKAAKEEVAALKKGKGRARPTADETAQTVVDQITDPERQSEINMLLAERDVANLTGRNWERPQMNALLQLREEAPGIDGQTLVYLAERRHSELFGGVEGAHGELPPSHLVQEPRSARKHTETSETAAEKLDKGFVTAARGRDKVGMQRAMVKTIKSEIFKETIPKGRRR